MEDITALTAPSVSATEVVVPNITPVSSTVGEKTLDGSHVAEVTPPNPAMAFHVVARDPPLLALLALGFPPDSQMSAPLAPDVAETVDHVRVNHGPNEHEMSVPPPRARSLATDKADRREGGNMNKNKAKLNKQKDRE